MANEDLLDMQGPQLPSFLEMANASAPRMQGPSPSPFAGIMYGQDVGRHDDMMKQAMYMAEMRKRADKMKMDEMEAAHPGRMDEIALKSRMAGVDLGDADTLAAARTEGNKSKYTEALAKGSDAQQKLLKGYGVDDWENAPDSVKQAIYRDAQSKHLAFADQSFKDFDSYMSHIGSARLNEPNFYSRMYGADQRRGGVQDLAASREKIAAIHEKARAEMAASKPNNMTEGQYAASLEQKLAAGTITDREHEMLTKYWARIQYSSVLRGQLAQPQTTLTGNKVESKKPTFDSPVAPPDMAAGGGTPPVAATVTPLPRAIAAQLKRGIGTRLSDGSIWTLDANGQPQMVPKK